MDASARDRLLQRRRLLQLRHERQELSRQFRELAPRLCADGLRFSTSMPASSRRHLGRLSTVPARDERVDWVLVPEGECHAWTDAAECAALLARAFHACGVAGNAPVLVVFHTAEAALAIGAADLCAAWPGLHDALYASVWIVPRNGGGWLVEASLMDREVCWLTG